MRRRLITVVICLLAGAVVNVAVAWGLALYVLLDQYGSTSAHGVGPSDRPEWALKYILEPGALQIQSKAELGGWDRSSEIPIPRWSRASKRPTEADLNIAVSEQARGWPYLALYYRLIRSPDNVVTFQRAVLVDWRGGGAPWRALPLRPIWLGFAINTVFYAAALWLPFFILLSIFLAVRRHQRVQRGLCPACRYPMGDSPVCSECGEALPKRAVA